MNVKLSSIFIATCAIAQVLTIYLRLNTAKELSSQLVVISRQINQISPPAQEQNCGKQFLEWLRGLAPEVDVEPIEVVYSSRSDSFDIDFCWISRGEKRNSSVQLIGKGFGLYIGQIAEEPFCQIKTNTDGSKVVFPVQVSVHIP